MPLPPQAAEASTVDELRRLLHENLAEGGSAFHLELQRSRGQLDDGADVARCR